MLPSAFVKALLFTAYFVFAGSTLISPKLEQPTKAPLAIEVTDAGIVIE